MSAATEKINQAKSTKSTIKISGTGSRIFLSVNGVRVGINVRTGPWVPQVKRQDMVKLIPKKRYFPQVVKDAMNVENNSDSREDWFEPDCVRLYPEDGEIYVAAVKAAQ